MGKIKKFKGGFDLFVTEDEKLLVTSNSRNQVYVYDLETGKLKLQAKTVSNVSKKAISPDKELLAAKNTKGQIALISMATGEEIGRDAMEFREGNQMIFTAIKSISLWQMIGETVKAELWLRLQIQKTSLIKWYRNFLMCCQIVCMDFLYADRIIIT